MEEDKIIKMESINRASNAQLEAQKSTQESGKKRLSKRAQKRLDKIKEDKNMSEIEKKILSD